MYGLVLEGGGAKGSYQAGAYQALREMDIEIGGVAGTSIGAINAALIIQDNWDKAYELWYNMNLSKLFDLDEKVLKEIKNLNFNQNNLGYIYQRFKNLLNNRGIELTKIKNLLTENIDEDCIRRSEKDFAIVTINLSKMEPRELYIEDIPKGKLIDYLIASSYLPTFKMETVDGSLYLDGGFYDNLPINVLASKGYEEIIAIRTFASGRIREVKNKDLNITYITPNEDLGGIFDFEQENIRHNMDLGYYNTLKVFKKLKGNNYYIDIEKKGDSDRTYLEFFLKLNQEQLKGIGKILNIKNPCQYRIIFEKVIPRLVILLGLDEKSNYEEIVLSLLEYAAQKFEVEKYKVYKFDEIIKEISKKANKQEVLESESVPKFIRTNDLLSRAVSEKMLNDIVSVMFNSSRG